MRRFVPHRARVRSDADVLIFAIPWNAESTATRAAANEQVAAKPQVTDMIHPAANGTLEGRQTAAGTRSTRPARYPCNAEANVRILRPTKYGL